MRSIRIAGLCFASMLVLGMALAGTASAAPLWLVCLESSGLTKYSTNQCTTASGTGKWQSLGLPAGKTDTVRIVGFTLRLTDKSTAVGKSTVKCNGNGSRGSGTIEGTNKGIIREAKIEKASENCEAVEGGCKKGEVEKVTGANLPWSTEIFETANKLLTKIAKGPGAAGEPGWEITCNTLLGSKTDKCTSKAGEEESAELINEVTGGVLLVRGVFEKARTASCTEGNSTSGEVEGLVAILLNSGNGLSVNKV
jgi:hypothetical protein